MGRKQDNAPVGNTCPTIDEVLTFIDSIIPDENFEPQEIHHIKELMEDIRSANVQLREWGNDLHERAEILETELKSIDKRVIDLI